MKRYTLIALIGFFGAILAGWLLLGTRTDPVATAAGVGDPVVGEVLYQASCAACHGTNLEGQPNWRTADEDGLLPAPPHDETGHTWHHGDDMLFTYTKIGGQAYLDQQGVKFNSGMPGFADQLSDQQIWDILAYIQSTWPERQRQVQAARTEGERLQKDPDQ